MASKKNKVNKRTSSPSSEVDSGGGTTDPIYGGSYGGANIMPDIRGGSGQTIRPAKTVRYTPPGLPYIPLEDKPKKTNKKPKKGFGGGTQFYGVD